MKKSYYAIIPAEVRYSNLPPNAKLLYGEITALANETGYCWANNAYFSSLYGVHKNTISRWINLLQEQGFIHIEMKITKGLTERLLGVNKKLRGQQKAEGGINNFVNTPQQKAEPPLNKKLNHNNTFNTTKNNTSNNDGETSSLHVLVRSGFEKKFKDLTGKSYYWTAKDGKHCKQLIAKIEFLIKDQGKDPTKDLVFSSAMHLIDISDDWIKNNLSISNLNSKFNEIISKNGNTKKTGNFTQQVARVAATREDWKDI